MAKRFKKARLAAAAETQQQGRQHHHDADDYMSAAFTVPQPLSSLKARSALKPHPQEQQRTLSRKEVDALATDRRIEGLDTPIEATNPGFKLLMKLGWKRDAGLGKRGAGITAPIAAAVKQNRSGLGHESKAEARRAAAKAAAAEREQRARAQELAARKEFRSSMSGQFAARRLAADLTQAQRLVEQMDVATGVSGRTPLWPPEPEVEVEADDDGADQDDLSFAAAAQARGGAATSAAAATAAAAAAAAAGEESGGGGGDDADGGMMSEELRAEWAALSMAEQLACCLQYLRSTHLYCLYCGTRYDSAGDMDEHCPGVAKDDHDAEEL
ncbi:hypothetical protein JKP88DRAFT_197079 [Tribonema minus]|uniref:G-patch domain-containing protein n=1 Tax=Tribonema minus TaxID=303371 RepID=A0A835ZDF5_9STRA|nr:hypothetical protein JKP88DRAFT_197079 [Tribonema minus]